MSGSGGFDAGLMAQRFEPELIIADVTVANLDAGAMCRLVRRDDTLRDTKIVLTGPTSTQEEIHDLLVAGADDFVKKPFNIDRLMERVGELLER